MSEEAMQPAAPWWQTPQGVGAIVFTLLFLILSPCATRELSWDDRYHFGDYPAANSGKPLGEVIQLWHWQGHSEGHLWRPIPKLIWRSTGTAGGRTTALASLFTSVLGGLCAAAFAECLRRGIGARDLLPWALLPLLHPLASDVLHPLVGQSDLLAMLGTLAAWALLSRGGMAALASAFVSMLAAVLSKESAAPALLAIPAILALGAGSHRVRTRRALIAFAVLALALAAKFALQYAVFHSTEFFSGSAPYDVAGEDRKVGVLETVGRYVSAFVGPRVPQTDYSFLRQPGGSAGIYSVLGVVGLVVPPASLLLLARIRAIRSNAARLRARRSLVAGVIWTALFLTPYLQIISFVAVWGGRFAFPSLFGIAVILRALPAACGLRREVVRNGVAAFCAVGAVLLMMRSPNWKSEESLWSAESRREPRHAYAWSSLGAVYDRQGREVEALAAHAKAVELWPNWIDARTRYAMSLSKSGKFAEAEEQLAAVEQRQPGAFSLHYTRAAVAMRQGRFAEAVVILRKLATARPNDPAVTRLLNEAERRSGQAGTDASGGGGG